LSLSKRWSWPVAFQGEHAKVYENPGFLPRAWLASQVSPKKDLNEVIPSLRDPAFDPYAVPYLEEPLSSSLPLLQQTAKPVSNSGDLDRGTAA